MVILSWISVAMNKRTTFVKHLFFLQDLSKSPRVRERQNRKGMKPFTGF